jgi:DNA-binding CsgD family transcriptional regulator
MADAEKLVERDGELAALDAALTSIADGAGRLIVVEGPAGIGKSALLDQGRELAPGMGFTVLSARGSELEIDFPFGVVRQLFEGVLRDEDERAAALAGAAAPAEAVFDLGGEAAFGDVSFSALHGLYWMTLNLAGEGPLLLVVDDLHWCDRPSLRFLAYLANRLEGTPIGVLAGLRSTDPGVDPALVAELAGGPATEPIRPAPLSAEAVAAVVETRLDRAPDADFNAACVRATGGNPLLLGELLRALAVEGATPLARDAGVIDVVGPRAIARTVRVRLSRLPPEATETARAVAILGDGTDVAAIAGLVGRPVEDVARVTGALARAEILRPGSPLGFAHPLIRQAVYEEIPAGERQLQHGRAAQQMNAAGASSERVAAQLLASPPTEEPWVADVLADAAAKAIGRGASDVAVTLLTRMLAEPLEEQRRARVLIDLGIAEAKSTSSDAAIEHLTTAFGIVEDPGLRALAGYSLTRTLLFVGEAQRAAEMAAAAAASLPAELRGVAQMIESVELTALYFGADVPAAEERFEALRDLPAEPSGGESVLAAAASYDWMYRGGTAAECAELALRALEGASAMEVDTGLTWVVANVVIDAAERPEAQEFWERALARSHNHGSMFGVLTIHLWRGFTQLRYGELPAAEESLRSGIEQITLLSGGTLSYTHGLLCSTLLEQGRIEEAAAALHEIERPTGISDGALLWRSAEIELLLARREWEEALRDAREHAELCDWRRNPAFAQSQSFEARALAGLGRSDEAIAVIDDAIARAERWGAPGAIGRLVRVRGEIRGAEGIEDLERAVELLERSPMQLELAKALAALGAARRRDREPKESREPLRRAYELAEVCGAAELARAARTELHATGARPRGSALKGPESLTPSERRVTEMAVEGMTNKEIAQALYVTPKTVEVHLSNAYRKLEIGSRRELASALGE